MPDLDVTELLSDSDFSTTFSVTRTTESVGGTGRAANAQEVIPDISGIVVPDRRNLIRLPDGSRQASSIEIYTTFQLTAGEGGVSSSPGNAESTGADIVTWKGRNYVVAAIEDWSEYGIGFVKVAADYIGINL